MSNILTMKDKIRKMELSNDEQTINLFYDETLGKYVAFGPSAYYTTIVADPYAVYSKDIDMPMVALQEQELQLLCKTMIVVEHKTNEYYIIQLHNKVGQRWYHTWVDTVKKNQV